MTRPAADRCIVGDVRTVLPTLPAGSVQCIVTSPPFWGLRDYGHADQIGMEPSPDCLGWAAGEPCGACYVCTMVAVSRELRRVLRDDGTFWLELGDSYAANRSYQVPDSKWTDVGNSKASRVPDGLKPKDLCGIPWRVALALQADGWFLRSDIVWARPNPMPESVQDRPTKAHSYLFLLAKRATYYYDVEAIRHGWADDRQGASGTKTLRYSEESGRNGDGGLGPPPPYSGRNAHSVWTIATAPYSGAHFACWPPVLVKRCILAGTSEAGCCAECGAPRERERERVRAIIRPSARKAAMIDSQGGRVRTRCDGTVERPATSRTIGWRPGCKCGAESAPCLVLDPFLGSGTTAKVAQDLGRRWLGVELNPDYVDLQAERAAQIGLPLLAPVSR